MEGSFHKIESAFDDFVVAELYTDGGEGENPQSGLNKELRMRFTGSSSNPEYVVVDPETLLVLEAWSFQPDMDVFKEHLEQGLRKFQAR